MHLKDILPNTEYATCGGTLVLTGDTVEPGWYQWTEKITDVNTGKVAEIERIERSKPYRNEDPWGGCSGYRATPKAKVSNGIRVLYFKVDEDGVRIGKGIPWVVRLADIPGTWAEYLTLYAQEVRLRVKKERLEAAVPRETKAISGALSKAGVKGATVKVTVESVHADPADWRSKVIDVKHVKAISFDDPASGSLLRRLAKA